MSQATDVDPLSGEPGLPQSFIDIKQTPVSKAESSTDTKRKRNSSSQQSNRSRTSYTRDLQSDSSFIQISSSTHSRPTRSSRISEDNPGSHVTDSSQSRLNPSILFLLLHIYFFKL